MFAMSGLASVIATGCSTGETRLKEHRIACQKSAKAIVYDADAWASYVAAVRGSSTGKIQAVAPRDGYSFKFGSGQALMRQITQPGLQREDVFVFRGDKEIARLIDYVDLIPRGAYHEGLACTLDYPSLYFRTTQERNAS
jgi:hypothetical protein